MNKILKMLLTVVLFFSVGTAINVKAEGNVAKIGDVEYATLGDAINAAGTEKTTITLIDNETLSYDVAIGANQDIVLDLNGKTITTSKYFDTYGKLEVKDSSATSLPTVSEDYSTVTYQSGKIVMTDYSIYAFDGGQFTLTNGTIELYCNNETGGLYACGDSSGESEVKSTIIINGGYVHSAEFSASVGGKGATLVVNDGVLMSDDNAVVGGNGTNTDQKKLGGTSMTIKGGTFIGNIKSSGYISMAVYHPQEGTLNITGGTFYSSDGNGICVRGGDITISDDTKIIAKGNTEGWCGDSKKVTASSAIFVDYESKYYDGDNINVNITGGEFTSDVSAIQVLGSSETGEVSVSDGSFSSDVSQYLVSGNEVVKVGDRYEVVTDGTTEVETEQNTLAYDEQVVDHIKETATTTLDEIVSVEPIVLTEGDKFGDHDYAEEWNASEYKTALEEALKDVSNIDEVIPYGIALHVTDKNGTEDLIEELDTKLDFTLFLNDTSLSKVKDKKFTLYNIYFNTETDEFEVTPVTSEKTTVTGNSISFTTDRFSVYALVTFEEVTPTPTPESKKSTTKTTGGWDDGGPFTTDTCGNVFDRWGNKIYEAKGCNVGGYNLVRTSVED